MAILNANVAYNYQKTPGLITSDKTQTLAGLAISLRDNTNLNRNVNFNFPIGMATPNYGAGSPTLLALQSPRPVGEEFYAGIQVTGV